MRERTTRYADWSRARALLALGVTAALIGGCLALTLTRPTLPVNLSGSETDMDLFHKVVLRVHAGDTPYEAFERVFRSYDYPVRSVFNYRTPLQPWLLGQLPNPVWGAYFLDGMVGVIALLAFAALRKQGLFRAAACAVLLVSAFLYCFITGIYLYAESWSGALIALSICAYAHDRRRAGFAAGLLALFFRELALPYVVGAAAIAWSLGRRREALAWGVGLVLYGAYLVLHVLVAAPRLNPAVGLVNGAGWIHFGGLHFVLATCRVSPLLALSPSWVAAFYLPLSLLGIVGWRSETGLRIGAVLALYLAAFSIVGGFLNAYWGLMYTPLLPFGLVWAPAALRDLAEAVFRRRPLVVRVPLRGVPGPLQTRPHLRRARAGHSFESLEERTAL